MRFFSLILLFVLLAFSNNTLADTDSTIRVYIEYSKQLKKAYQYDSSLLVLEKAIPFLGRTNNLQLKAEVYNKLAEINFACNKYDASFYYFKQAIRIKKDGGDNNLVSEYLGLSMTFLERGNTDTALLYSDTARYIREQTNDSIISTSILNNIGRIYMDKGDFDIALQHFYLALENAQKESDTVNLIYIHLNMGSLYQRMDKNEEALNSYLKSLEISSAANNLEGIAYAYSIGIIYRKRGDLETALHYYTEAIEPCTKLNKLDDLSNIYSNMSNVYMLLGKYEEAAGVLRKSIALSSKTGYQRQLGIAYANMGKVNELTGQYDSAGIYMEKSLLIFQELGARNLESTVYRMMSEAYETAKDFENALICQKKHIDLSDSIFSEKVENQIADLRTKYETEKKEKENVLLKKDNELQKKRLLFLRLLVAALVILGAVSLVLFYQIRKNALTKKELAELKAISLEDKVAHQKRELASGTLSLSRNLEFMNSLIEDIRALSEYLDDDKAQASIRRIIKKLEQQNSDKYWVEFEARFQEIHRNFYQKLHDNYSDLTSNDLRISALMKMGMNTKEICSVTFQNVRAVEAARLRLRKKLNLPKNENLSVFLQKL